MFCAPHTLNSEMAAFLNAAMTCGMRPALTLRAIFVEGYIPDPV
jgi:hypothetical protein